MNEFAKDSIEPTLVELMTTDSEMPRLAPEVSKRLRPILNRTASELSLKELTHAIARGLCLAPLVRRALDLVETQPLASAGWFAGDLLRGLVDVPQWFWRRHSEMHDRYRAVLREAAAARRNLPPEQRMDFWNPIPDLES
jgi:hypothetical protein